MKTRKISAARIGRVLGLLGLMFFAAFTSARAQTIQPYVDCVEREFNQNGAATGNYIAYFGYSNSQADASVIPAESQNNFFLPNFNVPNAPSVFAPGVHPRVFAVTVPIGLSETWFLSSGVVTASFNTSTLCAADGANSRLITYQGRFSDGAAAANGIYDLQFQLFNSLVGGAARTSLITLDNVSVANGVFTVQLDLGAAALSASSGGAATPNLKLNPAILDASDSFFEIGVRPGNSTGAYTTLTPRQPITAVPLAMRANTANNAFRAANADNFGGLRPDQFIRNTTTQQANSNLNISGSGTIGGNLTVGGAINGTISNATNATNAANAAQLGGVAANQYLTTTSANSNFIQNTTAQQTGNFNVSGNGAIGGTLTANAANINGTLTATTTNIGGATNQLLNMQSSSPIGTWLTLNNTTGGGRQWSVISTGASNGEGAGKLLFYDLTNNTGRLLLSDTGANITGNLTVSGSISGATKNFKIDHPLDPANKTLTYTSVESPDMKNIYDGNITTDANGEAVVTLPDYFEALNKDFRYQLTVIGAFAQVIVAEEISGNRFKIKTDRPNVKVSWQVTGIRHDKFAEDNRPAVEENKAVENKGDCLYQPACRNKSK